MAVGDRAREIGVGDAAAARRVLIIQLVAIATWAVGVALVIKQGAAGGPVYDYWLESTSGAFVLMPVAILLGRRRPRHHVSWLFTTFLCVAAVQLLSGALVESASGVSRMTVGMLAVVHDLAQLSFVTALIALILLYPTGHVVSPRWRIIGYAIAGSWIVNLAGVALRTIPAYGGHRSPLALEAGWAQSVDDAGGGLLVIGMVGAILSAVLRFKRSSGLERQQMKWFAYTVVVGVVVLLGGDTFADSDRYGALLWAAVPSAVMASVGLAIVLYGLYDIDRIVSRTVAYAAIVVVLVGVYAAASVAVAPVVAAAGGGSNGAVAVATLTVAAVLGPVRRRVHTTVDRLFDRRRYDARLAAEAFRAKMRGEVDAEQLQRVLTATVHDTLAPTGVTVWVR